MFGAGCPLEPVRPPVAFAVCSTRKESAVAQDMLARGHDAQGHPVLFAGMPDGQVNAFAAVKERETHYAIFVLFTKSCSRRCSL